MSNRLKSLVLTLILILVTLTACGPNANASPVGDDLGEYGEVTKQQAAELAEEGSATVYYNYWMNNPNLDFKIQPVFYVNIVEAATGTFEVSGITEKHVTMRMTAAGGPTGSCQVQCDVNLRFSADGEIQLDQKTGECIIPVSFQFQPQQDEWILETDCPEESQALIDCAVLSLVMADPSIYTFTKSKRDPSLSSDPSVVLKAEIQDVKMPAGVKGICNW
ncbi:MAG: hypothetical protein MUP11_09515 [Anaerolineales bacterium]|nr:hypothetical protein [Anaerolineales bacterium]